MSAAGSVTIEPVRTKAQRRRFVEFPYGLLQGDPSWVAPLRIERYEMLDEKKNPFFEHGRAELFLAVRDGVDVGRISAQVDELHQSRYGDAMGFFGFFDAIEDRAVAVALVDAARDWLRGQGCLAMRGPHSFTINDDTGVLIDGFDTPPYILMTHNPPYYDALMDACGLHKAKDLLAWEYDVSSPIPAKMREAGALVEGVEGLVIRQLDKRRLNQEVRHVVEVFNEAWSDNWGFVPMTESGLAKLARELKLILVPELALIAEYHGKPVAISIALPDLNDAIRDLRGRLFPFGIIKLLSRLLRKKHRRVRLVLLGLTSAARGGELWGLSLNLYVRMYEAAKRLGIEHAELSWTLEDNKKVNRGIERMGGRVYKRYRVYEAPIGS